MLGMNLGAAAEIQHAATGQGDQIARAACGSDAGAEACIAIARRAGLGVMDGGADRGGIKGQGDRLGMARDGLLPASLPVLAGVLLPALRGISMKAVRYLRVPSLRFQPNSGRMI